MYLVANYLEFKPAVAYTINYTLNPLKIMSDFSIQPKACAQSACNGTTQ